MVFEVMKCLFMYLTKTWQPSLHTSTKNPYEITSNWQFSLQNRNRQTDFTRDFLTRPQIQLLDSLFLKKVKIQPFNSISLPFSFTGCWSLHRRNGNKLWIVETWWPCREGDHFIQYLSYWCVMEYCLPSKTTGTEFPSIYKKLLRLFLFPFLIVNIIKYNVCIKKPL